MRIGFVIASMTAAAIGLGGTARSGDVDIAVCLDSSGTMNKLIDAARVGMWDVVARLAVENPGARLRVAILTHGNLSAGEETGWVRIESPLSTDLDRVASSLFAVKITGNTEYVARVVQTAVEQLDWDESDETRRILFVLGNESADQDPEVTLEDAVRVARGRDIALYPVYCGTPARSAPDSWRRLAALAGSSLAILDLPEEALAVESPFDRDLADLGDQLSATYVPLGESGRQSKSLQERVDRHASDLGSAVAALRAEAKAGALYEAGWDLVTAVERGTVDAREVPDADLPESLRSLSGAERSERLHELALERERIRLRIVDLAERRRRHLEAHGVAGDGRVGISDVMLKAIRGSSQAK